MSKPAYYPLTNKHLRFYFSNTERKEFSSPIYEKQFNAVRKVLNTYTAADRYILQDVIRPTNLEADERNNITDNIERISNRNGISQETLYLFVLDVCRKIAIELEYIPRERGNYNAKS